MCATGCTIYATNARSTIYSLTVQPTNPSPQELQEAALIHSHWGSQTMSDLNQQTEELQRAIAGDLHRSYRQSVLVKTISFKMEGSKITGGIFSVEDTVGTGSTRAEDYQAIGT
jgi:hypothetical protein